MCAISAVVHDTYNAIFVKQIKRTILNGLKKEKRRETPINSVCYCCCFGCETIFTVLFLKTSRIPPIKLSVLSSLDFLKIRQRAIKVPHDKRRIEEIFIQRIFIPYEVEMCFFIGWREGGIKIPNL